MACVDHVQGEPAQGRLLTPRSNWVIKPHPGRAHVALCMVTDLSGVVPAFGTSEARTCPTCQSLIHRDDRETRHDRPSSFIRLKAFPLRADPLGEMSQAGRTDKRGFAAATRHNQRIQ